MFYQIAEVRFMPATLNKDSRFQVTGLHGVREYSSIQFADSGDMFAAAAGEYAREFGEEIEDTGLHLQSRTNAWHYVLTHKDAFWPTS